MDTMNLTEISRDFDYVRTQLTGANEGDTVDDLYIDGYAPLNGGGWACRPKVRDVGRIWHRVADGAWYATPEVAADWSDLQWFGPFKSRAEAAMFLAAMATPKPRVCPCCKAPVVSARPRPSRCTAETGSASTPAATASRQRRWPPGR